MFESVQYQCLHFRCHFGSVKFKVLSHDKSLAIVVVTIMAIIFSCLNFVEVDEDDEEGTEAEEGFDGFEDHSKF